MKNLFIAASAAVALTACASKWSRPGSTEGEFYQDRYACEQDAARAYPAVMVQRMTSPGVQSGTTCMRLGYNVTCSSGSMYDMPPRYVTEDANSHSRFYAMQSCLEAKGYRRQ